MIADTIEQLMLEVGTSKEIVVQEYIRNAYGTLVVVSVCIFFLAIAFLYCAFKMLKNDNYVVGVILTGAMLLLFITIGILLNIDYQNSLHNPLVAIQHWINTVTIY